MAKVSCSGNPIHEIYMGRWSSKLRGSSEGGFSWGPGGGDGGRPAGLSPGVCRRDLGGSWCYGLGLTLVALWYGEK